MDRKNYIAGLIYGASAFTMWGLLPLYWKMVNAITPYQIFAQRVVWSFFFIMFILFFRKRMPVLIAALKSSNEWQRILLPSVFISVNWLLYIWAVNNNFVIETSLGYYINPLVLTLFGFIFYKERLSGYQKIGIGLAAIGVIVKTVIYGKLPIVALVLAVCFGSYGLLKKKSNLDSLTGLGFETLIIGFPSLIYMGIMEFTGRGITGNLHYSFWLLIALSGIVTATPLLMYAESTKKLPLNVVGFLQYISPTIALMLGIFVFGEPFELGSLIAFSLIWIGLGFFTYSQIKLLKSKG